MGYQRIEYIPRKALQARLAINDDQWDELVGKGVITPTPKPRGSNWKEEHYNAKSITEAVAKYMAEDGTDNYALRLKAAGQLAVDELRVEKALEKKIANQETLGNLMSVREMKRVTSSCVQWQKLIVQQLGTDYIDEVAKLLPKENKTNIRKALGLVSMKTLEKLQTFNITEHIPDDE